MDEFVEKLADSIDAAGLLPAGASVVVGVSGGADSVALMAALRELADMPQRGYKITAAHLNHCIRPDAAEDAEFTLNLARKWGVRCIVERRDVKKYADSHGLGTEEAARHLRYDFLRNTAAKLSAGYVALGHHGDDNVETILHHIIRGTHIRGLAGIPQTRPLGRGVVLVRPMLGCRRDEIEDYCRRIDISWRTDSTNMDVAYSRNFIRNELLPLIRSRLNPQFDRALLSLGTAAGQLHDFLEHAGREAYREALLESQSDCLVLSAEVLAEKRPVVRGEVLRVALEKLAAPLGKITAEHYARFSRIVCDTGVVALPGDWSARCDGREVIISQEAVEVSSPAVTAALACPGQTRLDDGRIVVCDVGSPEKLSFHEHLKNPSPGVEYLDADRLKGRLVARCRGEGDRFTPLGAPGGQTVSDFLTNLKLPHRQRGRVLCICDDEGIVYLAPLRIAERVKVTDKTRKAVRISIMISRAEDGGENLDEKDQVG